MGVGVSAHRLAGTVARHGAVGTIASVDLRRHHEDLMQQTQRSRVRAEIEQANLVALDREITAALRLADGHGLVSVNVMRAVSQYADYVRQACESGAGAITMGAGLPLDLPELTADYPRVALIPILSDARGILLVIKKWMRKHRLPDAIVIEHPGYAGGHLGAATVQDVHEPKFEFARVLEETFEGFKALGIERERIPLIPAGGINTHAKVKSLFALGASAVQVGTPFAVTEEGDAHPQYKRVLADARPEDIVTFMSVAGLPARAVRTPFVSNYLRREATLQAHAKVQRHCTLWWDCLVQCGLRDGIALAGQFCIDNHLAAALKGDIKHGLFFRGAESLPFGNEIRPVSDLLHYLLEGVLPAQAEAA